jgi:hypothetical protein
MAETPPPKAPEPSRLSYLSGGLTSALFCAVAVFLTQRLLGYYANHPPHYSQQVAQSIATAMKTLLVGSASLACFSFGLTTLGLLLLFLRSLLPGRKPAQG